MWRRLREDEKHERAIRALLRLEPNRRCINCNSLGPQYVCTNFWTFVCTNCSGIHREFTHHVKSVSMAKFTKQEVTALKEGGNKRARKVYFKEWDAQHHSYPDSDNVNRLRDFIKHVYVDRRFTGDSTSDKPPRVKNIRVLPSGLVVGGDIDGSYENSRVEAYQGGSKSPPYDDSHEGRYSDRSSPGGRSHGYDQESKQVGDYKRSHGRPPVINDWRHEGRRMSDGDYKTESQSPVQARNLGSSSLPEGRPVREILGENVVPRRISGPPKPNNGKAAEASALTQRTASSGSLVPSNESQVNIKLETTKSLIDFDADPEPIAPNSTPQPVLQPGNSIDDNWASFDIASEIKANQSTSNLNPLEHALSQLSYSASLSSHASGVQGPIPEGDLSFGSLSSFPPNGASVPSSGLAVALRHNDVEQWASSQHQQPMFSTVNSQPLHVPSVPTGHGYPNTPIPHAYHHASKPANEAFNSILSQPSAVEVTPSGRTELSENLFTSKHSSFSAPVQGWQAGLPQSTGISMQYNNNMVPIPSFSEPSRSTNPFDVSSKQTPDQDPSFLSISSLHSAMPRISPSRSTNPFDVSSKQTPDQDPSFLSISSLHSAMPSISPSRSTNPFDVSSKQTPDQDPSFLSISSLHSALPSESPSRSTNPFDVSSKQTPDQDPSFLSISSLHSAMPSVSPSRSTNPFDVSSKQTPDQDPSFLSISSLHSAMPSVSPSLPMNPPCQSNPSLAWSPPLPNVGTMHSSSRGLQPHAWNPPLPSIQAAPPNVPSSGTLHPSSLGNPSHAWNSTLSSPYASFLPTQAPTHASALGPGCNNGKKMPTNTPMPRQEDGNFGAERDIFGLSNPDQQLTGKPSTIPTSNPFPKRGNPFG